MVYVFYSKKKINEIVVCVFHSKKDKWDSGIRIQYLGKWYVFLFETADNLDDALVDVVTHNFINNKKIWYAIGKLKSR